MHLCEEQKEDVAKNFKTGHKNEQKHRRGSGGSWDDGLVIGGGVTPLSP